MIGVAALMTAGIQPAHAASANRIALSVGGLMSAGLEISIDLDSGFITKRTLPRGSLAAGEKPNWQETSKQLSPDELLGLKDIVRQGLDEGLRSKSCDEEDEAARKRGISPYILRGPPSADAISTFYVQFDGRTGSGPERQCESDAFKALWNAAYHAASTD
jgi:hypothetical protein